MRKLICLLAVLLISIIAGLPLAHPALAAATAGHSAALSVRNVGTTALVCILPHCNGPYCRQPNGCWVCCTD